ncbi:MAG: hypothetical protein ACI85I_001663 [Arenicella sp.]|jgi:hypothetical protein
MENYVKQLLSDLEESKNNWHAPASAKIMYPDHPAMDYGLDFIAQWESAPYLPMYELFGMEKEALPPTEKLTDSQQVSLCDAILDLMITYHIRPHIPPAPVDLVYTHLRKLWQNCEVQHLAEGQLNLDMCDFEPENCFWGKEICDCKDFMMDEFEKPKDGE